MAAMRYHGEVILHLQQYSRRLNLFVFYQATRRRIPEGDDLTKLYCKGEFYIWVCSSVQRRIFILIYALIGLFRVDFKGLTLIDVITVCSKIRPSVFTFSVP